MFLTRSHNGSGERDRFTHGVQYLGNGYVRKWFGSDVRLAYVKALAVHSALGGTRFVAPRAVCADEEPATIDYELIPNATSVMQLLERAVGDRRYLSIMRLNRDAAALLGVLHLRLRLEEFVHWSPPAPLVDFPRHVSDGETDEVFLHCDYSPVNLLVCDNGELAVIDPSPNRYFTAHSNIKGHRLVDVATYTAKLLWPFRLRTYGSSYRRLARMLRRDFLSVYERTCGVSLDRRLVSYFEYAVVRSFIDYRTKSSVVRLGARRLARVGRWWSGTAKGDKCGL